jgi:hypothetical protein
VGQGRGSKGEDGGGDLTNVQCKAIQNCHNKSPWYNEYMLTKMRNKIFKKERYQTYEYKAWSKS